MKLKCKNCKYRRSTKFKICPEICTKIVPYMLIEDIDKQPKECPLLNKKAYKRNLL